MCTVETKMIVHIQFLDLCMAVTRGRFKDFEKGSMLVTMVGWQRNLDLRWSKKVEIVLKTISFGQNIYISIFKFSPFLSIKSYQFSKFTNALIRKEKHPYSSQ